MVSQSLAKDLLFIALIIAAAGYGWVLFRGVRRLRAANPGDPGNSAPGPLELGVGFVTDFFDALGIGSFAPTTTIFRLKKMVDDKLIPGTMNVGHTLPTIAQALIFTRIIEVDIKTLLAMVVASVLGSFIGAGIVVKLPKRSVQVGMGIALVAAAILMLFAIFGIAPAGGEAIALTGGTLLFAAGMNFILGALMTLGIGLYAPCLILVSLLGMNPKAAFPIMMSSCAFLMPIASARFVREAAFQPKATLGLLLGGIPGVLIAAFLVKSLPLGAIRWLVIAVVLYAAFGLLKAGFGSQKEAKDAAPGAG